MKYPSDLDPKYQPLSPWGYFFRSILYSFPIIGFVFLVIHCFNGNINKRNYARSFFCIIVVVLVLSIILAVLGVTEDLLTNILNLLNP